jgi:hypothetical protein
MLRDLEIRVARLERQSTFSYVSQSAEEIEIVERLFKNLEKSGYEFKYFQPSGSQKWGMVKKLPLRNVDIDSDEKLIAKHIQKTLGFDESRVERGILAGRVEFTIYGIIDSYEGLFTVTTLISFDTGDISVRMEVTTH